MTVGEPGNEFEVVLGKSVSRNVWGWKKEDHAKAMRHWTGMKWKGTKKIIVFDDSWVVVSQKGLKKEKVFGAAATAKKITDELKDPTTLPLGTKRIVGEAGNEFEVVLGKSGFHNAWGWRKEDHANAMRHWTGLEWTGSEEVIVFNDDWIVGSRAGLEKENVVDATAIARRLTQELGDSTTKLLGTKMTVGEAENAFEAVLGKSGFRKAWGWKREDHDKAIRHWNMRIAEEAEEQIERLSLAEVVALLGNDPLRLSQYLRLYHPELSQEDVGNITAEALRGLQGVPDSEDPHQNFAIQLDSPVLENVPSDINVSSFELRGTVAPGIPWVQVTGNYTRKIRVRADGKFSANIPLPKTGQINHFEVYAFDAEQRIKSIPVPVQIQQTGQPENAEDAFRRLLGLREDILQSIQRDPARYRFLLRSLELSYLKYFTYDEEVGIRYLEQVGASETSPTQKRLLQTILEKFRRIKDRQYALKPGQKLYFFQKYTIHEIQELVGEGATGVIVANEQGLGKTVTVLVLLEGSPAVIITPNAVVTTWGEQEEKFMLTPSIDIIEGTYRQREQDIAHTARPQILTNVEFTQGMTNARRDLLSNTEGMLVVDEADYLGTRSSQQARGTAQIEAQFKLLLTATPFKRVSQISSLLGMLRGNDSRFQSAKAFARAFPAHDTEAMTALFLLLQQHTIRIRKQDVFEEYDRSIPLDQQSDKLPAKVEIDPSGEGHFQIAPEQAQSILELFSDDPSWCQRHRGHDTLEDRQYYRHSEGYFPKKHAIRQIMNDTAYIGRDDLESPKHQAMDRIVQKELAKDPKRKIVIFCEYTAQVEEYLRRYAHLGAVGYYGQLPQNSNGYLMDDRRNVRYFKVDEYENPILDRHGDPIPSDKEQGRPMRALDYSRIRFQNNPDVQILVANYKSGSVGVTFTAADAVIFDDLAPTYRDQYQAADRAHRIDNDRKKYDVTYYTLQAQYPKAFLDALPPDILTQYFSMGTFDEVHYRNLARQKRIFHRILDGVGNMNELAQVHQQFMRDQMPFLFAKGEVDEAMEELMEDDDGEVVDEEVSEPASGQGSDVDMDALIGSSL